MSLFVHTMGAYASYPRSEYEWRDDDYRVNKLVKAVKGVPINGSAQILSLDKQWITIDNTNRANAFELFGRWGAKKLAELGISSATLVPVPSSSHTVENELFTGTQLAQAVAYCSPEGIVARDPLRFRSAMEKSSKGGSRNWALIKANLVCTPPNQPGTVVLIDDVMTLGGHLRACADVLRSHGMRVEHALTVGRTVKTPVQAPFAMPPEDLEDFSFLV